MNISQAQKLEKYAIDAIPTRSSDGRMFDFYIIGVIQPYKGLAFTLRTDGQGARDEVFPNPATRQSNSLKVLYLAPADAVLLFFPPYVFASTSFGVLPHVQQKR